MKNTIITSNNNMKITDATDIMVDAFIALREKVGVHSMRRNQIDTAEELISDLIFRAKN